MFNPFKKFNNTLSITKNITHMINQIDSATTLFNLDPYNTIEEIIILNFYFQSDILEELEKTNYQPNNYIYFGNGEKMTVFEIMANLGGFFHEVATALNDNAYNSILQELGSKGSIYNFLDAQLPKKFTDFVCFDTRFESFYYPYKFSKRL